jgi:hypothetical protein
MILLFWLSSLSKMDILKCVSVKEIMSRSLLWFAWCFNFASHDFGKYWLIAKVNWYPAAPRSVYMPFFLIPTGFFRFIWHHDSPHVQEKTRFDTGEPCVSMLTVWAKRSAQCYNFFPFWSPKPSKIKLEVIIVILMHFIYLTFMWPLMSSIPF